MSEFHPRRVIQLHSIAPMILQGISNEKEGKSRKIVAKSYVLSFISTMCRDKVACVSEEGKGPCIFFRPYFVSALI